MTATPDAVVPDLSTRLGDATLPNPVLTAAGCAGAGRELAQFFDVTALGAVVTRSVSRDTRPARPGVRMAETPSGLLSDLSTGGPGVDGFLATELPWLAQRRARAVVSITASTLGEYAELARRVGNSPGVTAIEVNLRALAGDPHRAARVTSVVRRDTARGIPVLVKLAPDVTSIVDTAGAVVDSGADGLVLGGRLRAMAIDPATMRPAPGPGVDGETGGLSGPAVRPVAVRCVWEVHRALPDVPLVGVGGISCGTDAFEFLLAGASAVQVGSFAFRDPCAPLRVRDELSATLADHGFARAAAAVGHAHRD